MGRAMTVYVDEAKNKFRGMKMCHMMADTVEELHEMADVIGLERRWYQPKSSPHYDVCLSKRKEALANGAEKMDTKKLVELVRKHRL
jgi:hypothetical protein